jgi:Ca2+-transporting ATPase
MLNNCFIEGHLYDRSTINNVLNIEHTQLLLQAFAVNNDVLKDQQELKGDSTEVALMEVAVEQQIDSRQWPRIAEIPFDADRKLMTTFHKHENGVIAFTKGAPDILLERCPG